MKKNAILLAYLIAFVGTLSAQTPTANTEFTIVNVKGIIKIADKQLAKGQRVTVNDKLKFSKDAIMLITDATKTLNIVIEPSTITATKIDLEFPLSTFLKIAQKTPISKPNQTFIKTTEEFGSFFKEKVFIVGSEMRLTILGGFEMDESNFFYMAGKYGTEVLNKQLDFKDSLLIINKSVMIDATSKPATELEMLYTNVKAGDFVAVCKPNIAFIDEPTLKSKLQNIVDMYIGTPITKTDIPRELANYINQYYGKTDYDNIKYWIEKNLKVL